MHLECSGCGHLWHEASQPNQREEMQSLCHTIIVFVFAALMVCHKQLLHELV